mgnify:CR=1 FL=1
MIRISTGDICIEVGGNQSIQIINQHIYINAHSEQSTSQLVPVPVQADPSPPQQEVVSLKKQRELQERAKEGAICFSGLVEDWKKNFGIENSEQPDRGKLLVDSMTNHSRYIFAFIRACGGLTKSVIAVTQSPDPQKNGTHFRKECRLIAENMAQVGSILCPPLAELLEYPFKP